MIKKVIISFMAIVFIYVAVTNIYTNKVVIHLGIFVGNWELPNGNDYKTIDSQKRDVFDFCIKNV